MKMKANKKKKGDAATATLTGKFITLNVYVRNKEFKFKNQFPHEDVRERRTN